MFRQSRVVQIVSRGAYREESRQPRKQLTGMGLKSGTGFVGGLDLSIAIGFRIQNGKFR
jgi:hypothetical protein